MIEKIIVHPHAQTIIAIAHDTVAKVFKCNTNNLVRETHEKPNISTLFDRFRGALEKAGFQNIPDSNNELYEGIILPLSMKITRNAI